MKFREEKIIDLEEWDDLVRKTYNRPYSFQQQDGCKSRGTHYFEVPDKSYDYDFENDSIPENLENDDGEMGVSFKAWLERDPKKELDDQKYDWELEMWWERQFYPHVQTVANDLCEKGILESGKYMIDIDW